MAEENQVPENDTPDLPPEVPPVEQEARAHGWKPKEEFEADERNAGKKWRSAEDFMDRKSLFDKIEGQSSEIKTLKKGLQSFAQHYTNVEKAAFQRAYDTLKAERMQHLEEGNLVKAEQVRDQMDDLKEKIESTVPPVPVEVTQPQEFVEWKDRNSWYQKDRAMTTFADDLGRRLHLEGYSPSEVLKEVEIRTKATFAEKFQNPNRSNAPQMVNPGRKAETRETFRLTEDETRIMNNMVRTGIMTREQYIADLKKMRGN